MALMQSGQVVRLAFRVVTVERCHSPQAVLDMKVEPIRRSISETNAGWRSLFNSKWMISLLLIVLPPLSVLSMVVGWGHGCYSSTVRVSTSERISPKISASSSLVASE